MKNNMVLTKNKDFIKDNKIFIWLSLLTGAILSLPYLAMKFDWIKPNPNNPNDRGVDWSLGDFLIMGILIFGMGTIFILIARKVKKKNRIIVAFVVFGIFVFIWAHLAVGIVDSWPLAGS